MTYFNAVLDIAIAALSAWIVYELCSWGAWKWKRQVRRRREERIAQMVEAWRTKDRQFMQEQRRIRGKQ